MEKLSLEEQEVSISFDRVSDTATLYASDITWIRKMDKMCEECPDAYKCIAVSKCGDEVVGKTYSFPKKLVSTRKPMTKNEDEEVRQKRLQNLNKGRSKKTEEEN